MIYSGSPATATTDQLVSQRIADARYIRRAGANIAESLAMQSQKITGLADGSSTGDAIHYGQLLTLMRAFGFRRSHVLSVYMGDLPLANNVAIASGNIVADSALSVNSVTHFVSGTSANYLRVNLNHGYGTDKIRVFV